MKLDCGMLRSTIWFDRDAREVFITALLMAEPREFMDPAAQLEIDSLELTGWSVPAGWYGFVPAAGVGILHAAGVSHEIGMGALKRLGTPEPDSRSMEFDGRRLVRVNGGFVVLNFMRYRDRDYTTAERSRRYRERKASHRDVTAPTRDITQEEVRDQKKKKEKITISGETATPSSPPILTFPCDGKLPEWHLTPEQAALWSALYPSLDVTQQCRHALGWVLANPGRKKTASGMPAFLNRWLARTQDKAPTVEGKPSPRTSGIPEYKRA